MTGVPMLIPPEAAGDSLAYVAFLYGGIVVGIIVGMVAARNDGVSFARTGIAAVLLALGAIVGARLHSAAEQGSLGAAMLPYRLTGGGLRLPGAAVGLCLAAPIVRRLVLPDSRYRGIIDRVALGYVAAIPVTRLGCWFAGCCFGNISSLPWAVRYPQHSLAWTYHSSQLLIEPWALYSLPVHPLPIYFIMLGLAALALGLLLSRRRRYEGQVGYVVLSVHELGKAGLDYLRAPFDGYAGYTQRASLGLGVLFGAAAIVTWLRWGQRGEDVTIGTPQADERPAVLPRGQATR